MPLLIPDDVYYCILDDVRDKASLSALGQTCYKWRLITNQYLFSSIKVTSLDGLDELLRILISPSPLSVRPAYILRLDVVEQSKQKLPWVHKLFYALFPKLPTLRTVVFESIHPEDMIFHLHGSFPILQFHSVEKVYLKHCCFVNSREVKTLISMFPNMLTLLCSHVKWTQDSQVCPVLRASLSSMCIHQCTSLQPFAVPLWSGPSYAETSQRLGLPFREAFAIRNILQTTFPDSTRAFIVNIKEDLLNPRSWIMWCTQIPSPQFTVIFHIIPASSILASHRTTYHVQKLHLSVDENFDLSEMLLALDSYLLCFHALNSISVKAPVRLSETLELSQINKRILSFSHWRTNKNQDSTVEASSNWPEWVQGYFA
ncbi:hypothetical protein C8Q75DRAFT_785537 [Abortiporus biennis]|nr:hypothetical protein C8Q75DRAFT_785537 [Abortiporus biennis]